MKSLVPLCLRDKEAHFWGYLSQGLSRFHFMSESYLAPVPRFAPEMAFYEMQMEERLLPKKPNKSHWLEALTGGLRGLGPGKK